MSDRPSLRANQTFGAFALLAIARPRRIGIYFVYSDCSCCVRYARGGGRLRFLYLQEVAAWNRLPNASAVKITPDKRL
jgi:hypothetical protein